MVSRLLTALALGGLLAAPAAAERLDREGLDRARIVGEGRRACPQFGAGFAALPGTSACTRVSGRVRAEAGTPRRGPEREGAVTAAGRLAVDTRTQTDYGSARAFVRFGTGRR